MAQPIPLTLPPRDPQHELEVRLQSLPAKHAEAILAAYEVLQLMHDKGVLELIRGTLGGGEVVVEQAVAVVKGPAAIRASRNALLLINALSEVEPGLLNDFTNAVPKALAQANREEAKPPGLLKLLRTFLDADFRRGLAAFSDLLQVFGRNLSNKGKQNGNT